jgi:AraC family transcriptional regulator of adaptative response/methylated-DNA-[protein]-cysteine methyltransferase
VTHACRLIEAAEEPPSLVNLAESVGMSVYHFHRVFKRHTGVTPRSYASALRDQRVRDELAVGHTVTAAIYFAGFGGSSRFYEASRRILGMTASDFRAGGDGCAVRFALGECWLGSILVAATDIGICAVSLGDDPETLRQELKARFPRATLIGGDTQFERFVAQVVGFLDNPATGLELPLDIRGTAFQRRVWEALQQIPAGATTTYTQLAQQIGQPKAARAVASACAANALAVVIPCHRVVRTDGSLSGYRWGVERKQQLLQREQDGK